MKKMLSTLLAVLSCYCSYSQSNIFPVSGSVGIGTSTPLPNIALQVTRSGANGGADYPSLHIMTTGTGSTYGPILYLNGTSGTGGKMWGMVSSGAFDAPATGAAGNFAIYDANAASSRLVINTTGNVGIGTLNPSNGLLVAQGLITSQTAGILPAGNNDAFSLFAPGGYVDGSRRSLLWSQPGLTLGRFGTEYNLTRSQIDFVWSDMYNRVGTTVEAMRLTGGGNLGIGTANPDAKLSVNGNIHAREVKVDLNNWPDYVFHPDYQLISLKEVQEYIAKNQHLPELPSAQEVTDNGLKLGEMNKLLTKKIEELTLYLIEKDKQLSEQNEINLEQQKKNEQLDLRLKALEKSLSVIPLPDHR